MLQTFVEQFQKKKVAIEAWLDQKRELVGPEPLYASVDLRNAGFKIVPIDTNLFPAGWNNLCPNYSRKASEYFRDYFEENFPGTKCLLILAEDHTRNLYYFSNLRRLQKILEDAGFIVKIGSLNPEIEETAIFQTAEGEDLMLQRFRREGNNLYVGDRRVCQVIVNNDFSAGIPDILKGLEQNLLPSPDIGWHYRRKSENHTIYKKLIEEFAAVVGLDAWHFSAHFRVMDEVNFDDAASREKIALVVEELLAIIQADYARLKISGKPSVFLKNNSGTYGVGVFKVESGDEIRQLNQKTRKQMRIGKGGASIRSIILQEGVVTIERVKGLVAEPVMYLVGNHSVGGFYRLNNEKSDIENLNSRGMQFTKSCFHENFGYENLLAPQLEFETLNEMYGVLAVIAAIAAGYEIKALAEKS